jgi:DNA-binding LytR/AlgR family response regulator
MTTQILIIEDEKPAQLHLERLLLMIDPDIKVLGRLTSVSKAVDWLRYNKADLVFMDIQLEDGVSFNIFEMVEVKIPVIFTTAYDEFAIKAFKVNSIDYLLKPLDEDDVRAAMAKFQSLKDQINLTNLNQIKQLFTPPLKSFQERFMVHRGERLMSVGTDQIAYFEGEDRYVYLFKKDGSKFIVDYRLSDLENLLDPKYWFRLNRSFICHIDSIKTMVNVSKSRIKIELEPAAKRDIIISSENSQTFKKWLNQ